MLQHHYSYQEGYLPHLGGPKQRQLKKNSKFYGQSKSGFIWHQLKGFIEENVYEVYKRIPGVIHHDDITIINLAKESIFGTTPRNLHGFYH